MAAPQKGRAKIRDLKVMMLQGGRTYTLIKIIADDGLFGIAEAYGSPGVGVKEQILSFIPAVQWAAAIRDYIALETVTGQGGWMDQVLQLDGPYIKNDYIQANEKPGLGIELNPDVVKAHLAEGETY